MREFEDDIMDGVNAWYVRKDGEVKGPFARGLLLRHRVLGRLRAEDEVSIDRINWFRAMEIPALDPSASMPVRVARQSGEGLEWSQERERARKRWMEERWRPNREAHERSNGVAGHDAESRQPGPQTPGPRGLEPSSWITDLTPVRSIITAGVVVVLLVFAAWMMNRFEDKAPMSIRLLPGAAPTCESNGAGVTPLPGCASRETR